MLPRVTLEPVKLEDVQRMVEWLTDREVNSSWYGLDDNGRPLHIGYDPGDLLQASDEQLVETFNDDDRKFYSIYSPESEHIGEGQLVVEWPLEEAQLFILIGRKDLWHHHYGTAALLMLLDEAFDGLGLHRVWIDVPEYNHHALQMFRHVGFVLEGHFRRSHRRDDEWYDSFAMGLLVDEYIRRRERLVTNLPD